MCQSLSRRGYVVLIIFLAAISFSVAPTSNAAETFQVATPGNSEPDFTIFLPAGWRKAESDDDSSTRNRFVFNSPTSDGPYIFCRVEKCDQKTRDERLQAASEAPHREFLDEGEVATDYFDPENVVLWQRAESKGEFVVLNATFFGNAIYHFKFFTPSREFRSFTKVLQQIVGHLDLHGEPPNVAGVSREKKAAPSDEELDSVLVIEKPSSFWKYFWMTSLAIIIGGLYLIDRSIRVRRHREAMAELDRQKEERLASGGRSDRSAFLREAESFTKHVGKRRQADSERQGANRKF